MGALTVLGRDDTSDVILDDPGISRRHSEIRVTTDGPHFVASIRDLGSTNGTFVNSERVGSKRLEDGDRITLGRTSMTYRGGRR
jgi:pSer/pThr/pTyr-binding forkhead associated (FHA) protein